MTNAMPLIYQFEMTSQQSLRWLLRNQQISKAQEREARRLLEQAQPFPESLFPVLELMFLVQTAPPTQSLH